jgi:dipeptidyl aminopeptidase
MERTSYERLPQGETQNEAGGSHSQSTHSFARPPIYYGDGPFDPPSSDSDDEGDEHESFIEKNRPSSPGRAEAGAGSGWTDSADGKVRAIIHNHCSVLCLEYPSTPFSNMQ